MDGRRGGWVESFDHTTQRKGSFSCASRHSRRHIHTHPPACRATTRSPSQCGQGPVLARGAHRTRVEEQAAQQSRGPRKVVVALLCFCVLWVGRGNSKDDTNTSDVGLRRTDEHLRVAAPGRRAVPGG